MNRPENTAITRSTGSRPMKDAVKRGWVRPGDRILDFACGKGADVDWLQGEGFEAEGYDPHPRFARTRPPSSLFDIVHVIYLVNVLDSVDARRTALTEAWEFVRPGGWMMVVARTAKDIEKAATAESWPKWSDGYWSNRTRGMFQRGHSRRDLRSLIEPLSPEPMEEASVSAYSAVRARKGGRV